MAFKRTFHPFTVYIQNLETLGRLDKDIPSEINAAIESLLEVFELPAEFKDHELHNEWAGHREFHVRDSPQPGVVTDVLVIYRWRNNWLKLVAVAAGSHERLF